MHSLTQNGIFSRVHTNNNNNSRSYATIYQEAISYVKTKGQFDVSTMGNVVRILLVV